jgi:hypothetical protein
MNGNYMDWQIPIGGSTSLYATTLDLIKKFKWFKCCRDSHSKNM